MTLKAYREHFKKSLSNLYPHSEIDSFFFLLIEEYLDLQRIDLVLQPNFEINNEQLSRFNAATHRLQKEEPIQYILEKTVFYGLPFSVNKNVLIPRPETEELAEWILKDLSLSPKDGALEIVDVGTGSGCIPITIAKNASHANVSAIDISKEALLVAKKNAKMNGVSVDFMQIDILSVDQLPKKYDIIISNPPYVRESEKAEIKNNVLENEPHLALFVEDDDPFIFYDKIAILAKEHLVEGGTLYFEINQYLGKETLDLLSKKGFNHIELRKDLFGNDRMIKASL